MAETWGITLGKRLLLATADAVARPFAALLLPRRKREGDGVWKILVVELWHIGDVVIATTALQALRARYPDAWITLLAKPHADEILRGSDLVDEIIAFDFPWTAEFSFHATLPCWRTKCWRSRRIRPVSRSSAGWDRSEYGRITRGKKSQTNTTRCSGK